MHPGVMDVCCFSCMLHLVGINLKSLTLKCGDGNWVNILCQCLLFCTGVGDTVGGGAECFLKLEHSSSSRIPAVESGWTLCTDVPCQLLVESVHETNAWGYRVQCCQSILYWELFFNFWKMPWAILAWAATCLVLFWLTKVPIVVLLVNQLSKVWPINQTTYN